MAKRRRRTYPISDLMAIAEILGGRIRLDILPLLTEDIPESVRARGSVETEKRLRAERDSLQQQVEELQHGRYAVVRELKDLRAAYAALDDALIKAEADLAALRTQS